jgi:cephalosporin hydroxylase
MKIKFIVTSFLLLLMNNYIQSEVYLYSTTNHFAENLKVIFNKFDINFKTVNYLDNNDDKNLYIIDNIQSVNSIDKKNLPKYYIIYQTSDLTKISLTNDVIDKLLGAIAIWDYSWNNISSYKQLAYNYLYCPLDYEFFDPVILPCLLPIKALDSYKEILSYSNKANGDISSHLPAIFAYTLLQNSQIIIEAGVRGGESTLAFSKAINLLNAKLIGIDIEESSRGVYAHLTNASFVAMNDLDFPSYYKDNQKPDIIFIDTSHAYEHTLAEIKGFVPVLAERGMLMFHDSNVTPINETNYVRLNNTTGYASGVPRGVTRAIKEYFNVAFDEYKYCNFSFVKDQISWKMIHYPFCNGLTILQKIKK